MLGFHIKFLSSRVAVHSKYLPFPLSPVPSPLPTHLSLGFHGFSIGIYKRTAIAPFVSTLLAVFDLFAVARPMPTLYRVSENSLSQR